MAEIIKDTIAIAKHVFARGSNGAYADPERYDRLREQWFFNRPELARGTTEMVNAFVNGNGRIYEAAAGTGILSLALAERGFHVTCNDIQEKMLKRLQDKARGRDLENQITTLVSDMNSPFFVGDGEYDGVVQLRANRYIVGNTFYSESLRVLKEGGVLILPVFTVDRLLWWKNAGIRQHTTPLGIANDMLEVGFRKVEGHKPREFFARHNINIPAYYMPSDFLVARK